MVFITLKKGDRGEAVAELQSLLNKVGAMLVVDGDYGRGTLRAVQYAQDMAGMIVTGIAESALWEWLDTQPEPFELLDTEGIAFIAKEETGGLAYYESITRWPHFPGHASGITIGVGYDLRFNTEDDFRQSWGNYLPEEFIQELVKDIGKKGTQNRARELKEIGVLVPFKWAWPVLTRQTLPRYYETTRSVYTTLDQLPGLCRCALVSLVFNRGASLTGSSRREMRAIQKLLQSADGLPKEQAKTILDEVEEQFLLMKRLWSPKSGLVKRRQSEANLWRKGLALW